MDRLRRRAPDVGRCHFEMVQLHEEGMEHLKAAAWIAGPRFRTWVDLLMGKSHGKIPMKINLIGEFPTVAMFTPEGSCLKMRYTGIPLQRAGK